MTEPYKAGDIIAHTESDLDGAVDEEFIEKIRKRLATALGNERRYGHPMNWGEADKLLIEIARLKAKIDRLETTIENMDHEAKYPRD